jgi:hypothetical protein
MNYNVIADPAKFNEFVEFLPELLSHEVYYFCLFGRHKYDPAFPNTKDSGQLARLTARNKEDLIEKVKRLEVPIGAYSRDGIVASNNALALYIALNPRNLIKANKGILVEVATRFAEGHTDFNPVSVAHTQIHHATDRKLFVDFDFDDGFDEVGVDFVVIDDSFVAEDDLVVLVLFDAPGDFVGR